MEIERRRRLREEKSNKAASCAIANVVDRITVSITRFRLVKMRSSLFRLHLLIFRHYHQGATW